MFLIKKTTCIISLKIRVIGVTYPEGLENLFELEGVFELQGFELSGFYCRSKIIGNMVLINQINSG